MSKKNQNPYAAAFMAVNSPGSVIRRNTTYGSPAGASLINSPNSSLEDNVHYDEAALILFDKIESTIKANAEELPKEQSDKLLTELEGMRKSYKTSSFKDKYVSFMSSISDHATILSSLAPLIPAMTMMIAGHCP